MALGINKDLKCIKVKYANSIFTHETELTDFNHDKFLEYLSEIDIPEGITKIGEGCFEGCKSLETVRIPASIKTIGRNAFIGCNALNNVVFEDSVTGIDVWLDDRKVSKLTLTPPYDDLIDMLLKGFEMEFVE